MRVLVTGAGGFLGRRLLSSLALEGHDAFGASRQKLPEAEAVVLSNALDPDAYGALVKRLGIDAVINTIAAGVHPQERDARTLMLANAVFPAQLALACRAAGARLLVHIGSSAEYAAIATSARLEENSALTRNTLYGGTKAAGSLLVLSTAAAIELPIAVLRLFNIFGPGEQEHRLFPTLVSRLQRGDRVPLSSGAQIRDFLYVDDACRSISRMLTALSNDSGLTGEYNLGAGQGMSVRDFAIAVADAMGQSQTLLAFGDLPLRKDDAAFVVADTGRLDRIIGPSRTTSIADAVSLTRAHLYGERVR